MYIAKSEDDFYTINTGCGRANTMLMELCTMINPRLKDRQPAERTTAGVPLFPYACQDEKVNHRQIRCQHDGTVDPWPGDRSNSTGPEQLCRTFLSCGLLTDFRVYIAGYRGAESTPDNPRPLMRTPSQSSSKPPHSWTPYVSMLSSSYRTTPANGHFRPSHIPRLGHHS